MYQQYVYMILISFIRNDRFFGASRQFHFCINSQKQYHINILVIKAGDRFFSFFIVTATIVQTSVLYCTALVLYHRHTTAKFTFSAGLVNNRKTPGVLSYCAHPMVYVEELEVPIGELRGDKANDDVECVGQLRVRAGDEAQDVPWVVGVELGLDWSRRARP